jgi:hypothetical protein
MTPLEIVLLEDRFETHEPEKRVLREMITYKNPWTDNPPSLGSTT